MHPRVLPRCAALLLALLLGACAGGAPQSAYPPLDFSYLTPLALNVATIDVQTQYRPSGVPPDVTQQDPEPPAQALQTMAQQRLKAVGASGSAVFVINDAALVRTGDTVTGVMSVTLSVYTSTGVRAGFAQATVTRQVGGVGDDLPTVLYDMTRQLMQQMNVEFEYQVRRSLGDWLVRPAPTPAAGGPPVGAPPVGTPPMGTPPVGAPPVGIPPMPPPEAVPSPVVPPSTSGTPPLPYALPPAGPLAEPTTVPPPPMPALPYAPPSAGTLAPPTTAPPPPSPPLPYAPPAAAPLAPAPAPPPLPPPGPVID